MMQRRGFLGAMLAAAAAPAIVRAGSLMKIVPPKILVPELFVGELGIVEDVRYVTSQYLQLMAVSSGKLALPGHPEVCVMAGTQVSIKNPSGSRLEIPDGFVILDSLGWADALT